VILRVQSYSGERLTNGLFGFNSETKNMRSSEWSINGYGPDAAFFKVRVDDAICTS
jgi:hypothetical protein